MKKTLIILCVSALPFTLFAQGPLKGPLDKKVFIVDVTKDGKKKPMDPDEFKFDVGKFKSKNFTEQYKFKNTPYQITSVDSTTTPGVKVYTWTAESVNDLKDAVKWEGTIAGEDMDGTAELVNDKGEKKWSYTFTGKLKKKAGQK